MKYITLVIIGFSLVLLSCKDYYNDMIDWTDKMKIGTELDSVKKYQPKFLKIEWEKPDTLENFLYYNITEIKGNRDILNMSNYLVFEDNKYQGRAARK